MATLKIKELNGRVSLMDFPDEAGKHHWFFVLDNDPECRVNDTLFILLKQKGIQCVFNSVEVNTYKELLEQYKFAFAASKCQKSLDKLLSED